MGRKEQGKIAAGTVLGRVHPRFVELWARGEIFCGGTMPIHSLGLIHFISLKLKLIYRTRTIAGKMPSASQFGLIGFIFGPLILLIFS
jgi:hypothetical protein